MCVENRENRLSLRNTKDDSNILLDKRSLEIMIDFPLYHFWIHIGS